jgi:hypothetical protein
MKAAAPSLGCLQKSRIRHSLRSMCKHSACGVLNHSTHAQILFRIPCPGRDVAVGHTHDREADKGFPVMRMPTIITPRAAALDRLSNPARRMPLKKLLGNFHFAYQEMRVICLRDAVMKRTDYIWRLERNGWWPE